MAQISIAVSAKLISAFVFGVHNDVATDVAVIRNVIITILNVRVAYLFVVGLCSNFIKIRVLKGAIRSMLNVYFAASHYSVVPIYTAILSKLVTTVCTNKHPNAHSSVSILSNPMLKRRAFLQMILGLAYVCVLKCVG